MSIFKFKKIMAITIFSCSFSSFAANPPLQFHIHGSFEEVVPPCNLTSESSFNLGFDTTPTYVNIGYETQAEFVRVSYQCMQDVNVKVYFSDAAHKLSSAAYQTTASHIGVKTKINGQILNPNEKLEFKSKAGASEIPVEVSLIRLAETQGNGGSYDFNLTGIIETEYN